MQERRPTTAPYAVVVDDNPVILLDVADTLTNAGFSVFAAPNAEEALGWFERHGDDIALMFTNVELGASMNGFHFAHRVAERWPLAALLISSERLFPQPGDMPSGAVFLQKPFSRDDVVARTREVLAGRRFRPRESAAAL